MAALAVVILGLFGICVILIAAAVDAMLTPKEPQFRVPSHPEIMYPLWYKIGDG